jgi:GNAT superfamily N-acetyltransferase
VLTDDEIREEVLVPPRRTFLPVPELRLVERPGWLQLITPSIRDGGMNEVVHAELGDDEADATIARVCAAYRAIGVKWRWRVGPGSTPADLGDRLARHGLVRREVSGMARATEALAPIPGIEVVRVDATTVDELTDVMASGWAMARAPLAPLNELALRDPRFALYLARIDGAPVGAASAVWFPRSVYLMGGVVIASHRGRGAYRALVAARITDAAARGIPLATSHARPESSAPILVRMGFREIVRFASYSPP